MIDVGLIMFSVFIVLLIWRFATHDRWQGEWLKYANYSVLLFAILTGVFCYVSYLLAFHALSGNGKAAWSGIATWVKPGILATPGVVFLTMVFAFWQSAEHVNKVRLGNAPNRHDRVVQIVSLPAVYAVMALCSLVRLYSLHARSYPLDLSANSVFEGVSVETVLAKAETCFWVGDLFEAWCLYQFGKLTLELIECSIRKQQDAGTDVESRAAARAMLTSHTAVDSLAWLGILLFLLVCFLQCGWSLYLLAFTADAGETVSSGSTFTAAGMVASTAAIWNLHIIQHTFGSHLKDYWPFTKFVCVKILVTFAYLQKGAFKVLKTINGTFPGLMQNVVRKIPAIGDIVNMSQVQFEMFYATMLIFECLIVAIMHRYAWSVEEEWYREDDDPASKASGASESTALLGAEVKTQKLVSA